MFEAASALLMLSHSGRIEAWKYILRMTHFVMCLGEVLHIPKDKTNLPTYLALSICVHKPPTPTHQVTTGKLKQTPTAYLTGLNMC